jgi:hypothetical protein
VCEYRGVRRGRCHPLRAERRRSVGPLPQILRQGRIIFGEFVVSFTFTHLRGIRLSHLPFLREGWQFIPETWVTQLGLLREEQEALAGV